MYNKHLDAFIQVADSGSIMKAAEKLFISTSALTKQINLLEKELDVQLFNRSVKGVSLTPAGHIMYDESKRLIKLANSAVQRAKEQNDKSEYVIRVATSLMTITNILQKHWSDFAEKYPNIVLQMIPVAQEHSAISNFLKNIGDDIDVMFSTTAAHPEFNVYVNSIELFYLPACIAVPKRHHLASRTKLTLEDLYGETIIMLNRGVAYDSDEIRNLFEQHPQINIHNTYNYDYQTFNQVVSENKLLLSAEPWESINPLLKVIPVDWDFKIPFGVIYPKNPSRSVYQLVSYFAEIFGKQVI